MGNNHTSRSVATFSRMVGLVALAAAAFVAEPSASNAQENEGPLKIFYIGIAAPTGFFAYLHKGALDAAADLGVDYTLVFPDSPNLPAQVEKITAAIAAGADGIIINGIAADEAFYDVIAEGHAQGVAFGSALGPQAGRGTELRDTDDPFLFHVGADEYEGGYLIGKELLKRGVKGRVVAGNQQPHDSATCQPRAAGVVDAIREGGLEAEVQELTLDPGQITETMSTYLRVHPDTGAMVSVCSVIGPFLEAKQRSGRDDLMLAGFDVDEIAVEAIKNGEQELAIDQQQYWRGYMPVLLMAHHLKYGLVQSNHFLTGPAIIDASTIEEVENLVAQGYR